MSIRSVLFGAFLVVVVIAVGTVAIVVSRAAAAEIAEYDTRTDELEMTRVTHWLTGYYELHASWDEVQPAVDEIGVMLGRRIVVTNTDGRIVADTRTDETELFSGSAWRTRPLRYDELDPQVGAVYVSHDATIVDSFRSRMAGTIRLVVVLGSGLAIAAAIAVSFAVSRAMIAPIIALVAMADRAAAGDMGVRAPVPQVTELKSLATAFNTMMADIQSSVALRRSMVADVAHELRTPLANVRGYLEAQRDGVIPPDEAMDVLESEVTILTRLVDDLQDLSLADFGMIELSCEVLDVSQIAERVVATLQPTAGDRGLTLVAEPSCAEPPLASVDHLRLSQIVTNLVENAMKHTHRGGLVTVRTTTATAPATAAATRNTVSIAVEDTGAGIDEEHLEMIFERFYRADSSRSRLTGGRGLGLPIARSLTTALGGTIRAESIKGRGSTFVVTFPRVDP